MQKGIYGSPLVARMPNTKGYRPALTSAPGSSAPLFPTVSSSVTSQSTTGSRVTVTAVPVKRPSLRPSQSSSTTTGSQSSTRVAPIRKALTPTLTGSVPRPEHPLSGDLSQRAPERRPLKPPNAKKDPMAALFMPKHRAFSQLPADSSVRTRP